MADEARHDLQATLNRVADDLRSTAVVLTEMAKTVGHTGHPPRRNGHDSALIAELFELYRTTDARLPVLAARAHMQPGKLRHRFRSDFPDQYHAATRGKRGRPSSLVSSIGGVPAGVIFEMWKAGGFTLDAVGAQLGVTRERVRQVLSTIPEYKAEIKKHAIQRLLSNRPAWLDEAWDAYALGRQQLVRVCDRLDIGIQPAYKYLARHYGQAFFDLRDAHEAAAKAARLDKLRTPALTEVFHRYCDDETLTIEMLGQEIGYGTMSLWSRLERAFGEEFRQVSRTRKRGRKPHAAVLTSDSGGGAVT